MRKHWKTGRSVMASVVAVAMVGTLSFAPALASARQGGQDLATGSIATGLPEWAIDDGNAQVGDMSACCPFIMRTPPPRPEIGTRRARTP